MAYSEFDVVFGFDELRKAVRNPLQDTLMDVDCQCTNPAKDDKHTANNIMRRAFLNDIMGGNYDSIESVEQFRAAIVARDTPSPSDSPIQAAMNMYFAKGVAGGELKRRVQKGGLDVSGAMTALLHKFQEFFTIAEQGQLQRQIQCLDVPGFLEMLNSRLEAA
jgi:hypothetical protein